MKKIVSFVMFIVLVVVALSSLIGNIYPVNPIGTMLGMSRVMDGVRGTFVMQHGNTYMIAWEQGNNMAYAFVSKSGEMSVGPNLEGTLLSVRNSRELVDYMKNIGWRHIPASALPGSVSYGISTLRMLLNVSMPSVFFVPIIAFDYELPTPIPVEVG